jgi:hypothetical protein
VLKIELALKPSPKGRRLAEGKFKDLVLFSSSQPSPSGEGLGANKIHT